MRCRAEKEENEGGDEVVIFSNLYRRTKDEARVVLDPRRMGNGRRRRGSLKKMAIERGGGGGESEGRDGGERCRRARWASSKESAGRRREGRVEEERGGRGLQP
jgi:hypothetical protein